MGWKLAEAGPEEAPEIARLTGALLAEIMAATGHPHFRFDQEEARQRAADYIERGIYRAYLARSAPGDEPIGLITATESQALYAGGAFGLIPEFFVRPEWRSQGIGRGLLHGVGQLAAEQGWARLEVTTPPVPTFERTFAFYEREGFSVSGGRKMKLDL